MMLLESLNTSLREGESLSNIYNVMIYFFLKRRTTLAAVGKVPCMLFVTIRKLYKIRE